MSKPTVFIGSSTEGLEFAQATRDRLSGVAEITIWNEGIFNLGQTFIESLINALPRFDYAILVLTPDDLLMTRDAQTFSPRDNVIFELGLFMGRLGRTRTFIIHQANAHVKIPTDLSGISTAKYDWPRVDNNHVAAVGEACDYIRRVIIDLGRSDKKLSNAIDDIRSRQEKQEYLLRLIQIALQGIMTRYEYDKLVGLSTDGPFPCLYTEELYEELRRLLAKGLIQCHPGITIAKIKADLNGTHEAFDLKEYVFITDAGKEYLSVRDEIALNFNSDIQNE